MLLRARGNNIQSFACIWLDKGNQNEFLKHPKIKWLDGGLEPPTSGLPVHFFYEAGCTQNFEYYYLWHVDNIITEQNKFILLLNIQNIT